MSVLVDTGSSWTWFSTDQCVGETSVVTCNPNSYHYLESETNELTDETKTIVYGSMSTSGQIMNDLITSPMDQSTQGTVKFLSVPNAKENFMGILGLAPDSESSGPLLV